MAVITEVPVILDSKKYSHETHERSGGLHLSHVIRSIEDDLYQIGKPDDIGPQDLEAYRTAGFLFERALYDIILQDEVIERLGEFEVDGIVMTPDAINLGTNRGIESKATWRSMNHDVTDQRGEFASWWMQIMGYAKGLWIMNWDLYVFFINGGYGRERKPKIRHWEIGLDVEEVEANWRMITRHADWMREKGMV